MACDYLHSAYTTKMRLWDDPAIFTEVRWFRCAPGAKDLPHVNAFLSRNWDYDKDHVENLGEADAPRPWDGGGNAQGYSGKTACGEARLWADGGRAGVDPPLALDQQGRAACCDVFAWMARGGTEVGGSALWADMVAAGGTAVGGSALWQIEGVWLATGGTEVNLGGEWEVEAMAAIRIGPHLVGPGGGELLYTVPALKTLVIRNMDFENASATVATEFSVTLAATPETVLYENEPLKPAEHKQWSGYLPLQAGETITLSVPAGMEAVVITIGGDLIG